MSLELCNFVVLDREHIGDEKLLQSIIQKYCKKYNYTIKVDDFAYERKIPSNSKIIVAAYKEYLKVTNSYNNHCRIVPINKNKKYIILVEAEYSSEMIIEYTKIYNEKIKKWIYPNTNNILNFHNNPISVIELINY